METYYEDEDGNVHLDKNWARDYILGPLHDLEPSQESATRLCPVSKPTNRPPKSIKPTKSTNKSTGPTKPAQSTKSAKPINPANSTRPDSPSHHQSRPPKRHNSKGLDHHSHSSTELPNKSKSKSNSASDRPSTPSRSRSASVSSRYSFVSPSAHPTHPTHPTPPTPAPPTPLTPQPRTPTSPRGERKKSVFTSYPPLTRWNRGTILARSYSVPVVPQVIPVSTDTSAAEEESYLLRRSSFSSARHAGDQRRQSSPAMLAQERPMAQESDSKSVRRGNSLRERYPGDTSHRPLDIVKKEYRAPDKQPRLHNRHKKQPSDLIDSLDLTDPVSQVPYHHEGPYDATMRFRNTDKKYSPVEAVKDSNVEALKATPREYIQDSLTKHVPLHGTAEVPPGMQSLSGQTMEYQEGADLMREPDAAGGAYKRWDGIQYLDGDLKGKGEPSFTAERDLKEQRVRLNEHLAPRGVNTFEMQPGVNGQDKSSGAHVRQRSISNAAAGTSSSRDVHGEDGAPDSGLQRSSSTGKSSKLHGLRSAIGSLRRRRGPEQDD